MFQPHKTHFCGHNQKKCLCILARTHSGASQQVPPKERSNYQRKHPTTLQRHAIRQTETGGPHHDTTITPRDPNRANTSTFPQGHRVLQKNLHKSDMALSCHIKLRLQVHHDRIWLRLEQYLRRTIKIKDKPAHQECLSENEKIAMQKGTDTKDA